MSEWKEVKIIDLVEKICVGFVGPCQKFYCEKENGVPMIRTTNLTERGISFNDVKYISYEFHQKNKKSQLKKGDILVARHGDNGKACVYNSTSEANCLNAVIMRPDSTKINPMFFIYLFNSPRVRGSIESMSSGSVQDVINTKQIAKLNLLIPERNEQDRIASVLSSLDDKIDLLHRQNKTLEAMAETLFRQWFVEEADEGWENGKLGDYINIKHGYAFKGEFITTEKSNQILVTPGNFKIGGGFKVGKMKYYIESDYPEDYIFSSDDLITTMTDLSQGGDTLGYSALIPEHNKDEVLYLHNQRVGKVEFKKDVSKYFFYYLMKTDDYQWFILGGASGTSIRHTSPTSICSYPFKIPPMKIIEEFDVVVSGLISKVHKNQKQIQTLEKLRDTLLSKLMNGEVRVEMEASA